MFLHNPETDYLDHEYLDNKDIALKWNPKFKKILPRGNIFPV